MLAALLRLPSVTSPLLTPELREEADDLLLKVKIAHRWLKAFADETKQELVVPSISRALPYCARLLAIVTEGYKTHTARMARATRALMDDDEEGCQSMLSHADAYQAWVKDVQDCVEVYQEDVGKWYEHAGVNSADRPS